MHADGLVALTVPEALSAGGLALWALCFLGLGSLSIAYPFDLHGRIHPPAGSPGTALEIAAFACLPIGGLLIAVAAALGARGPRRARL